LLHDEGSWSAGDLVDELARIAEIARKQGRSGLEKSRPTEPFLARGIAMSPRLTISKFNP